MTKSDMFREAHKMAAADRGYPAEVYGMGGRKSHAYYFRLALLTLQDEERLARARVTGSLVRGFQIIESDRVWA